MPRAAPAPEVLEQAILTHPDDLEARYRLGAARLMHDDYDGALAQLLEIARRDPLFRGGAGRNGLLALFELLGEQDTRTQRYRSRAAYYRILTDILRDRVRFSRRRTVRLYICRD